MAAERSDLTGVLIVLLAASLFATLGVFSRFAYAQGLAPFAFVTWRAGVGAVGLWAAILILRRGALRPWSSIPNRARRALAVAVGVGAALNLAMFVAFERTTIALALLLFYVYPALVTAASVALGRERLDATRFGALVLALAGMVAVILGGLGNAAVVIDPLGVALAFVAAACQSTFVLISRDYAEIPTDQAMATILAGTAVVAALITLAGVGPANLLAPLGDLPLLGLLLAVGVFAAAVPSSLFLYGIRRLGGIRTGIVMLAEPVVGVALAALFLAEAITPLQAIGGATILAAALIVQRGTPPEVASAVAPAPGGP